MVDTTMEVQAASMLRFLVSCFSFVRAFLFVDGGGGAAAAADAADAKNAGGGGIRSASRFLSVGGAIYFMPVCK